MAKPPKDQDELTEEEAAKRRDEALKRALGTSPKPRPIKTAVKAATNHQTRNSTS